MVGSSIHRLLIKKGYKNSIIKSRDELDLLNPKVSNIFEEEKIDIINHHAAQSSVNRSVIDPVFDAKSNIIGTLQLLKNAVSFGIRRFIFASTGGAIYGDQDTLPVCEEVPCHPASPYAISKLSVEYYLRFYKENFDLDYISLRYSNVFGPRQDPYGESGVIAIFCNMLIRLYIISRSSTGFKYH